MRSISETTLNNQSHIDLTKNCPLIEMNKRCNCEMDIYHVK